VEVRIGNKINSTGKGNTKKTAHQEAAKAACQKLGI
jgi:dsRNA-specific ribonuclease